MFEMTRGGEDSCGRKDEAEQVANEQDRQARQPAYVALDATRAGLPETGAGHGGHRRKHTTDYVKYRRIFFPASCILLGLMVVIDSCDAAEDNPVCKDTVFDTKPIYYTPGSIADAKLSGMGVNPENKFALGVDFELVGSQPCESSNCTLLVFSGEKRANIAAIDLSHRKFRYCRSSIVQQLRYENDKECSKPYVETNINISTDDKSPYISSRVIEIRYKYYVSDHKINPARRCDSLEPPDGALRAQIWRFKEDNGSALSITEIDSLRKPKQLTIPREVPFLVQPIPERLDE